MAVSDSLYRKALKLFEFSEGVFNDVAGWWAATKAEFLSGDNTFTGKITASGGVEGDLTGNASTATKLATARSINVQDSDGTHTGTAASFDGTSDATIKIPSSIHVDVIGDLTGNASTATKLATARSINVQDSDGTHTGTAASFDGTSDATIRLPSTINADITGSVTGNVTVPEGSDLMYHGESIEYYIQNASSLKAAQSCVLSVSSEKKEVEGSFKNGKTYKVCVLWSTSSVSGKLYIKVSEDGSESEVTSPYASQVIVSVRDITAHEEGKINIWLRTSNTSYLSTAAILVF